MFFFLFFIIHDYFLVLAKKADQIATHRMSYFYYVTLIFVCVSLFLFSLMGNLAPCGTFTNSRTAKRRKSKAKRIVV